METKLLVSGVASSIVVQLLVAGVKAGAGGEGCIQGYDPKSDSWQVLTYFLPPLLYSSA